MKQKQKDAFSQAYERGKQDGRHEIISALHKLLDLERLIAERINSALDTHAEISHGYDD